MKRWIACISAVFIARLASGDAASPSASWSERLQSLPPGAVGVMYFRGQDSPMSMWTRGMPDAPPCLASQLARVTGYTIVMFGWAGGVQEASGRFDRKDVEACIGESGTRLGLKVTLARTGAVTEMKAEGASAPMFLAVSEKAVIFDPRRDRVEAVLAPGSGAPRTSVLWSLASHLGERDSWTGVVGLDMTQKLLGVSSLGLFLSAPFPPAGRDWHLDIGIVFRTGTDAVQARDRLAVAGADEHLEAPLRRLLASLHPKVDGPILRLEMGPVLADKDVLEAVGRMLPPGTEGK